MYGIPLPRTLTERVTRILCDLRAALAVRMHKPLTVSQRSAFSLLMLLWTRLHRIAERFAAIVARAAAGPMPPLRSRLPGRTARPPRPSDPLRRGVGWLMKLLGGEVAGCRDQLHYLLGGTEFAALLEAAPRVRLILSPLCRMLGIVADPDLPPALFQPPPPRPHPHRTAAAPPQTARTARPWTPPAKAPA